MSGSGLKAPLESGIFEDVGHSVSFMMKENRQMVRKRRKQDFTMDDLNDEEETEGVDEFKSTAKPTENRNRPPKRRSTRNIQYKVRGRNFTLYTYSQL